MSKKNASGSKKKQNKGSAQASASSKASEAIAGSPKGNRAKNAAAGRISSRASSSEESTFDRILTGAPEVSFYLLNQARIVSRKMAGAFEGFETRLIAKMDSLRTSRQDDGFESSASPSSQQELNSDDGISAQA